MVQVNQIDLLGAEPLKHGCGCVGTFARRAVAQADQTRWWRINMVIDDRHPADHNYTLPGRCDRLEYKAVAQPHPLSEVMQDGDATHVASSPAMEYQVPRGGVLPARTRTSIRSASPIAGPSAGRPAAGGQLIPVTISARTWRSR